MNSEIFKMGAVSILIVLLACIHEIAFAQKTEDETPDEVEEIVVYGEKSLRTLRFEVTRAEDRFYTLFNSLNTDDDFDVNCFNEAPIGSRIFRRVCRANFESDATAADVKATVLGIPSASAAAEILRKKKIMLDKMERLAIEHPNLLKALTEYEDARQILESERKNRCDAGAISCGQ